MSQTFCQRLVASCEKHAARTAMRIVGDETEVYDYAELLRQIRAVAYRLKEENIEFGDRVALIGENHPCWAVAYLGTLYHGAVCVPLDPHGEIETITNFLENSEAKLAFIGAEFKEKFKVILEKLGRHIPAVVWENLAPENDGNGNGRFFPDENGSNNNGFHSFTDWSNTQFPEAFAREVPK